jgi:hypothetical protein
MRTVVRLNAPQKAEIARIHNVRNDDMNQAPALPPEMLLRVALGGGGANSAS